jgi:glycosyltransferase involved in cell wall biosynthesis
VIAAKIGGAAELVEEGISGFYFEPGDTAALAEIVLRLSRNPETARAMRAGVRTFFDEHFSPQKNAEQLLSIYTSVIQ